MRSQILFSGALAGLAVAIPHPQGIAPDGAALQRPSMVTPAVDVVSETVAVLPVAAQAAAASAGIAASTETGVAKRAHVVGRDGTCAPQPAGSGPVATPDTPDAFLENSALSDLSLHALTPYGYSLVFSNLDGSLSASNYMGLSTLTSYDTLGCQSLCDRAAGCVAFNIYAERDPTLDPNAQNCPNPPSTTNFKCTLWGAPVSTAQATNFGQWRDSFEVVIAASNAYNKATLPPAIPGFTGPVALGGAINAPYDSNGYDTYMGYKFYPFTQDQGFNPQTCASACTAQTEYNQQHPAVDGTYQICAFFNAYVLSDNGVPQGLYCSLYNETWGPSYATNYGQYRDSDHYTVSDSYSYTLD